MKQRSIKCNPVAKYARKFNKAKTYTDRKQNAKAGYVKHRKRSNDEAY